MNKAALRGWMWVKGLTALALLGEVIVEAFIANAADHPSGEQLKTLSFLLAGFLAWIFWVPPWPSLDRYTAAWTAVIVALVLAGIFI